MKNTNHFKERKIKRKISELIIETTLTYGIQLSQNYSRIIFGPKELKLLKQKKEITKEQHIKLEKELKNRTLVLVLEDGKFITAFWANKRINRRFKIN